MEPIPEVVNDDDLQMERHKDNRILKNYIYSDFKIKQKKISKKKFFFTFFCTVPGAIFDRLTISGGPIRRSIMEMLVSQKMENMNINDEKISKTKDGRKDMGF